MTEGKFKIEWNVPFQITNWHVSEKVESETPTGESIVIGPKDKQDSEGHVFLTLIDSAVNQEKAKNAAREILQNVLIENFLLVDGRSFGSNGIDFLNPELVNKEEVKDLPKAGYANLPANVILRLAVDAERIEGFDALAPPYFLRLMLDGNTLQTGSGYWVKAVGETTWTVANS